MSGDPGCRKPRVIVFQGGRRRCTWLLFCWYCCCCRCSSYDRLVLLASFRTKTSTLMMMLILWKCFLHERDTIGGTDKDAVGRKAVKILPSLHLP